MSRASRNPFLPPRSLREFLVIYYDDVCDHANDAIAVITGLVAGDGHSVSHDREISIDTDTKELVIEVRLEIRISNPALEKVR
jgi:hypothetical protein